MKSVMFHRISVAVIAALIINNLIIPISLAHADGVSIPAQINKSFNPVVIAAGQTSRLTIVVYNPNAFQLTNTTWTDNLIGVQPGLYIANPPDVTVDDNNPTDTNCGSPIVTAVAGSTSISFSGGTVPAIAGTTYGECTVSLDVSSVTGGNLINDIPIGALTATDHDDNTVTVSNTTLAEATLEVNPVAAPSLTKSFAPNTMNVGSTAVLTVNITNNDPTTTLTNTSLTDDLTYLTQPGLQLGNPVAAAPVHCGSGSVTGLPGGTQFSLSGASIAPGATCTLKINITSEVQGAYTNTLPGKDTGPGSITTDQGVTNATAATANLNVQAFTMTKSFSPASIPAGGTSTLTLTIQNNSNLDYHNVGLFDDLYPYSGNNLQFVTGTDTYTNCGGMSASVTNTGFPSTVNNKATFSGGTLAEGTTCTITISVQALQSATPGSHTNTIPASDITSTEGATNDQSYSATLTTTGITISKTFGAASIPLGSTTTMTITITNPSPLPYTNADLKDDLSAPTDSLLSIAATPNASTTCQNLPLFPATFNLGARSIELQNGTIPANSSCTITVTVVGSTVGNGRTNTIPAGRLATTENGTNAVAATANISITAVIPTVAKAFSGGSGGAGANQIVAGGTANLTITITNPAGAAQLTNLGLKDDLSTTGTGLTFTSLTSNTCTGAGIPGTVSGAGTQLITLSGYTLAGGATANTCTIVVVVTMPLSTNGSNPTYTNTINSTTFTDDQGVGLTGNTTRTLTVRSVDLVKAFYDQANVNTVTTFEAGTTITLRITLQNYTGTALTVGTLTDNLIPPNLYVSNVGLPSIGASCNGGTVIAVAGTQTITLSGETIPTGTYAAPGTCVVTVPVTGTLVGGAYTNTITPANFTTVSGPTIPTNRTAPISIYTSGQGVTLTKGFVPATVNAGSNSVMTLTITAPVDTNLTNFSINDAFPANMVVGNPVGASATGCGTFTNWPPIAGATGIDPQGGTVTRGTNCVIKVNVTGNIGGVYANAIHPADITDTETRSLASTVTTNLTVNTVSTLAVTKNFQPSIIATNATSLMTIYLDNSNTSVLDITSVTDNLPGSATDGIVYVSSPAPTSTCGSGWSLATSTAKKIVMTGGSIAGKSLGPPAVDGKCSITVTVQGKYSTATLPATYNNTINTTDVVAKNVDTGETMNSTAAASAGLQLESLSLQLVKKIFPTSVNGGSASALSVQLTNTGSTALTGISFTDTMYDSVNNDNMYIAQPLSDSVGLCGGAITATAGDYHYAFSGGTLAANSTCTLQIMVTQNFNGTLTNTIPAGAVTTDQGATNPQKATASLTNLPGASLTKFFTPNSIGAGSSSTLTITIKSTGGVSLTGMGLKEDLSTDTNPSGLKISSAATSNTCNGNLTATPGTTLIQLANGSLAANSTCAITVGVTGDTAGSYLNCIPASRLTDTNSPAVTNQSPACDTLTVTNSAALGDFVWNDTNHNGIQDAGEAGIAGVLVTLYGSDGTTVLGTTTTDSNGKYAFTNLAAGTYYVGFGTPSGYVFSPQYAAGSTTANDSNANTTTNVTTGTNMSDVVTLTAGETDDTIDAGLYQPAALGDFVWNDTNHNGIQDAGEMGIAGVTVTLYGSDGTTVLGTTTTAADGSYHFTGLAAGTYYVGFSTPSGYVFSPQYAAGSTTANDSNANTTTNVTTGTNMSDVVTLTAGETDDTIDAGLYQPAALGDFVWNDTNHNGIQDAGEAGIAGVTVTLYGSDGTTVLGTTTTAADGSYHFTGLAAGTYYVGFSTPSGYVFSPQYAAGSTTANDSNANTTTNVTTGTNMSDVVTLTAGETDDTIDAGLYQPAALGDFVWNDTNHNGIQDAGEAGIAGVTVTLYGSDGTTVLGTTTTDSNGKYAFTNLAAGTYYVGFGTPSGYVFSPQYAAGSTTANDSNANTTTNVTTGTNMSDVVTLTAGETDDTIDAGLYQPAALGDFVWNDTNHNGIQDAGEAGIAGVTVTLYGSDGTTVLGTTTTAADGSYHFTGLAAGTYYVGFSTPSGYVFSPQYAAGSTTANDSNANTTTNVTTGTNMSDVVTLTAGETDDTIDAGLYQPAALGDYVWNDVNANGIQDAGEMGIAGVTVTLYGSDGTTVLGTTTTAADGSYHFTGLAAGTYYVGFSTPSGYVFSPQYAGGDTSKDSNANTTTNVTTGTNMSDVVTLTAGETDDTIDAGLYQPATLASLGDFVWNDANANGIQDSSEKGIPNVTVNLLGPTGTTVLKTTTTDANGLYQFTNLVPGTYRVQFVKPAGYSFSPADQGTNDAVDSDADTSTGITTHSYTLTAGENNTTVDAGLWQPASNLFDPPIGIKVLGATGLPELEWQMTWINNANAAAINVQITDPIPAGTTYVAASLSCVVNGASTTTSCIYDSVLNRIFWQGSIAADLGVTDPKNAVNSVVITFRITVPTNINSVNNQASSLTDTNGDGSFADETTAASVAISNIASWSRNSGKSGNGNVNGVNPAAQLPSTGFAPGVITSIAPKPANVYDTSSDLAIEIPTLGIKTAIVGVPQSGNTWDITWLGDQVGYLDGTAFPTWSGNSVLTGHVYESNGLPGPFVNLSTLKWGDQIIVHFAGQRYIYQVRENNVILPSDKSVFKHEDQPWLTLVTCKDYNASANTYKYRVAVGAVLVKIEPDTSSNPTGK